MNLSHCCFAIAFLALPLAAQPALENRLSAELKPPPAQFGTVPEADVQTAIRKAAALLGKHVTFRPDGTACAVIKSPVGERHLEWQDLRFQMVVPSKAFRGDEEKGIAKRVQVMLTFDQCRQYDPRSQSWDDWGQKAHPLFPRAIHVAWINGHPTADGGIHLERFSPGPASSLSPPAIRPATADSDPNTPPGSVRGDEENKRGTIQPGGGGGGLPPGMSRGK